MVDDLYFCATLRHTLMLCGHETVPLKNRKAVCFKSIFVPILIRGNDTRGNDTWVMTERILSQAQTAKTRYLPRSWQTALKCPAVKSKNPDVEPLHRIQRSQPQLRCFGHMTKMSQKRLAKTVKSCWLHHGNAARKLTKDHVTRIHLLPRLEPVERSEITENHELFRVGQELLPSRPS